MHPRPFYRSRLFWLGLPGLVFLLWGWWLSMGHFSGAGLLGKNGNWGISQSAGEVVAYWNLDGWPYLEVHAGHYQMERADLDRGKLQMAEHHKEDPSFRYVIIPYFVVVLAYVIAWLLTLAWWQRRKSRLLKLHTAP